MTRRDTDPTPSISQNAGSADAADLANLLRSAAGRMPDHLAISAPDGAFTYRELDQVSDRLAGALWGLGVRAGDRVGVWLDKSALAIAAMQASLRLGCAYVPLDPLSPARRIQVIGGDCALAAIVSDKAEAAAILGRSGEPLPLLSPPIEAVLDASLPPRSPSDRDALAYILYTSGSTGTPKGVCISHRNALAFVTWAVDALGVTSEDRLLGHAPLHFDLSVFDIYASFQAGATLYPVSESLAYVPERLVEMLASEQITVCYAVPSALIMMLTRGRLLDADLQLRALAFAGEPFPVRYVEQIRDRWPNLRLFNFYGPTETNVCTAHEVRALAPGQTSIPIGMACSGDEVWAVTPSGSVAGPGDVGQLHVSGPTVMLGYWGQPPRPDGPYATGDTVRVLTDGSFEYLGRSDGMVKVRGNRVELAEIEAALLEDPRVHQAAVIAVGEGLEARLRAYLVTEPGQRIGLLDAKRRCAERLPRYMIVDQIQQVDMLPRTATGKVDRGALQRLASDEPDSHHTVLGDKGWGTRMGTD